MRTGKISATFLLCLLLFFAFIPAHGAPQDTQSRAAVTTDVTIIIEQEKVRLTARQAVEYLQLQILDAAGEVVFDSGPIQGNEIAWPFQNGAGEAVKSGLYAYRLTVKEAAKESAQTRRGHFIVDRAKDRDGVADKLWVTSQNDGGIGADLTVSRDENLTVAGIAAAGSLTIINKDGNFPRIDKQDNGKQAQAGKAQVTALMAGTAGKIAKFMTATDLGDSSMTEVNGNVGIGTTTPITKLHVLSGTADSLPPRFQSTGAATFAAGLDFYHGTSGKGYIGVPGTAASLAAGEMLLYGAVGVKTSLWAGGKRSMTIDVNGHVGLGTSDPVGELHISGYGPFITLESNQSGARQTHIQNANGTLVFKPYGFGSCCAAMVIESTTGNVGIGTSMPDLYRKLDVVGNGATAAGIKSVNDRAFLSLTSAINGQVRTWSVESGVYGQQDTFGIYNWQTGKALMLSPEGRLTVNELQITGGADFAENFDLSGAAMTAAAQPGMVVSIDPAAPGKLALSSQAYDRRVAGVISGAGGVKPGMMMSQEGTLAYGQHPVALSGRVYVWVDAAHGAIKPGDLLTTSPTPGHAMKAANPAKAQGAILGKAMTELKSGKGLVLALVTLQ